MTTTDRTTILTRIAKLRALAEGSTSEAEALMAFTKAATMMTAYGVAEAELAAAEADGTIVLDIVNTVQSGASKNGRNRSKAIMTHRALARFCGVRLCYRHDYSEIYWTGHRPDVALAEYLADVIHRALESEYDNWRRSQPAVGTGAKAAFQSAMASRLSDRLTEMARQRANDQAAAAEAAKARLTHDASATAPMVDGKLVDLPSATALIVVAATEAKRVEVETAFSARHPKISSGRGWHSAGSFNGNAHCAGAAAGSRVGLNMAINSGSGQKAVR